MQVSHVQDHVTHAVIGGKQTIDFGISDSAEFFNILSSTLYKDQVLAVVRETLCNAWDAHIESNRREIPIEIELTGDRFVIRDRGLGIPADMIGPIYGMYGGSTKKNDGKQTGGFGLGCKAPFAYTDHFEVQSSCKGIRTIYNMSKSSAEVMGKPGIIPIASFPTTEEGLQVSIHLKDRGDFAEFLTNIKEVVRNGEMNATMNGVRMDVIPFSAAKQDFLISYEPLLQSRPIIMVRYGNVLYPIDVHKDYEVSYGRIQALMQKVTYNGYQHTAYIVFQAAPHTISVQPSREGLSMQQHTISTLTKLLGDFCRRLDGDFKDRQLVIRDERITETVTQMDLESLLSSERKLPGETKAIAINLITDMSELADVYLSRNYPSGNDYFREDIMLRLKKLYATGFNRGTVLSYTRMVQHIVRSDLPWREHGGHGQNAGFRWFQQHVLAPVLRGFGKNNELKKERLFLVGHGGSTRYSSNKGLTKVDEATVIGIFDYLPYLRQAVVISYTRNDVQERMHRLVEGHHRFRGGYMTYHVPRKVERVKEAVDYFTARGMKVYDLTVSDVVDVEEIDGAKQLAPIPKAPPRPKVVGLPMLSGATHGHPDKVNLLQLREPDDEVIIPRIRKPTFFFRINPKIRDAETEQKRQLGKFSENATKAIVKLFGHLGGLTINELQEKKLKDAGVKPLNDYLIEVVINKITKEQRFLDYFSGCADRVLKGLANYERRHEQEIVKTIFGDKELCKELKIPFDLSDEDCLYLAIWEEIKSNFGQYSRTIDPAVAAAKKLIDDVPTHLEAARTYTLIKDNTLLQLIDMEKVRRILGAKATSTAAKKTREILLIALKS